MRNLDEINPGLLKPSRFAGVSCGILFLFVLISVPLAYGAAPTVAISRNPLVLFMLAVCTMASLFALFSVVFRWGWRAKYYGVFLLSVAGISFLALIPCLALLIYGKALIWVKVSIVILYISSHVRWCQNFSSIYRSIFDNEALRGIIFETEKDAVYYMRKGDNFLLEKHFKFSQLPRDRDFLLFMVLALLMIPVMDSVCTFIGLPFVHIFLIVGMLPVSWMSVGLAFRAYLVFYHYPAQIKKNTGKDVYVDLESKPRPLVERCVDVRSIP